MQEVNFSFFKQQACKKNKWISYISICVLKKKSFFENLKTLATAFFCRRELDFSQITMAIASAFAVCCRELKGLGSQLILSKCSVLMCSLLFSYCQQKHVHLFCKTCHLFLYFLLKSRYQANIVEVWLNKFKCIT